MRTKREHKHRLERSVDVMIAALGTLPFLATLWLLVVLGARTLEESGAKIAAALKGEPVREPAPTAARLRIRMRSPARSSACARLRAAA
jgi:hypothetical protein